MIIMMIEILKLAVLFILVFIVMRMLGKTLLSQWTAYDLVTIIFLSYAGLGAVKIQSFVQAVISIVIIGLLYMILSKLSLAGSLSRLIIGEPTILIKHGEIIQENLKRIRYSLAELLSSVRSMGYPDIQQIEYAIIEPNGKISVIPDKGLQPVTVSHLNIEVEYTGLPLTIIAEGKIQHGNLALIRKSEEWVRRELVRNSYQLKEIFYAYTKDDKNELIFFPYKT